MDFKLFKEGMGKTLADAKKLGVVESGSEMLINDFIKMSHSEILKKQEQIQRLGGEISQLQKSCTMFENIVKMHNRKELSNLDDIENMEKRNEDPKEIVEKVVKKVKKKVKKVVKKQNVSTGKTPLNKFVGDSSA